MNTEQRWIQYEEIPNATNLPTAQVRLLKLESNKETQLGITFRAMIVNNIP